MQKFICKTLLFFLPILPINLIYAQQAGQDLFKKACFACHTIGEGVRVGPDLANVLDRYNQEWLVKFIQSSQELIKSGDSTAIAIFERNNKLIMPDQPFNKSEIESIISYITLNSPNNNSPNSRTPNEIFDESSVTLVNISRGKDLFEGITKFKNGGASCITCHNVNMPAVFSGGSLAKDLTDVFSRMGVNGVDGIIRNPPFPAMISSFSENPLTDQEVKDILAFLNNVDKWNRTKEYTGNNNIVLIFGAIIGLNIMFALLLFKWNQVKKISVNSFR